MRQASENPLLLAFTIALVSIEKKVKMQRASEIKAIADGDCCKTSAEEGDESLLAFQQAVLFLNQLAIHAPACHRRLTENSAQLPPAYAYILCSILAGCTIQPPSNCSPSVYRLIGEFR